MFLQRNLKFEEEKNSKYAKNYFSGLFMFPCILFIHKQFTREILQLELELEIDREL